MPNGFKDYLFNNKRKSTASQTLIYAKRYGHILRTGQANELLQLSPRNRHHAMTALASLSKYEGCYSVWKAIRESYQLKWSTEDSLAAFDDIFSGEQNLTVMFAWLKHACSKLPDSYSSMLTFDALTGLRPDEACQSIDIIHNDLGNYLSKRGKILEHYKYPNIFIRRTKKAYISLVDDRIINVAKQAGNYGYNALRLLIKRKGLDMHMSYCRKIFATYLRTHGVEQELVDLLQGRVPRSVFARHYYRPDVNYEKIRQLLNNLYADIVN